MNLECRLSVEDSPNSAGVVIDAIRCIKIARDRGIGGVLEAPSAYFMKTPPRQYPDSAAFAMVERFANDSLAKTHSGTKKTPTTGKLAGKKAGGSAAAVKPRTKTKRPRV